MFENLKGYGSSLERKLVSQERASVISMRGFNMAKQDRITANWLALVHSYNYDISSAGLAMIARARELAQNDPYAKKILRLLEKNVVGPQGFVFKNKSGEYKLVDGSYQFVEDRLANLKIEEAFWKWSAPQFATVAGQVSFRRLCQQIISTVWRDGEIFLKQVKGKINKFGYSLQPIEAIYVDHRLTQALQNGNTIVMGIELNKYRKPVAYYFRKHAPKDEVRFSYSLSTDYERVPADEVIHLFIQEIPNQIRGVTQFAPSGIRMKMLYQFDEASLINSLTNARVPGVIEKQPNQLTADSNNNPINAEQKDADGNWLYELEEGQWLVAKDGYTAKRFDGNYPHPLQREFTKGNLRAIVAGSDIGYSSVSNDYESVTWHSGKLEKMDERDGFKDLQEWLTENGLNKIAYGFLEMALLSGAINLPFEKFEKFYAPWFLGRGWEYTNPQEETNADIDGLDAGITTLEKVLAKRGIDIDDHFDQLAGEAKKMQEYTDKYGVKFNWNKSKTAQASTAIANTKTDTKQNNNGNGKAHKEVIDILKDTK